MTLVDLDPIGTFRQLAAIPAVTFNEYLVYDFLYKRLTDSRDRAQPEHRARLEFGFTKSGQLFARWKGDPDSKKRLILVAHSDKEGFLVRKLSVEEGYGILTHCTGNEIEEHRLGSAVIIRTPENTYEGNLKEKVKERPAEVIVNELQRLGPGLPELRTTEGHFLGIGEYKLKGFEFDQSGFISSPCVDNFAGVSVALCVLEGVFSANWPVNLDVLFTTCEEGGFCGIVHHILLETEAFTDPDCTWIVVDSSSKDHCQQVEIERHLRFPVPPPLDRDQLKGLDLSAAVLRISDRYFDFDVEVTQMLHVAARNAQRALAIFQRGGIRSAPESDFIFCNLGGGSDGVSNYGGVISARMMGGWCEASPIGLASELACAFGWDSPFLPPRVGSLGIPLGNYRNTSEGRISREKCHAGSLYMACCILGEMARLQNRLCFRTQGGGSRFSIHQAGRSQGGRETRLAELITWYNARKHLLSVSEHWEENFLKLPPPTTSLGLSRALR